MTDPLESIRDALRAFDQTAPPRSHVDALDLVAEVRQALGGHHVAYPENEGNPLYDRTAYEAKWLAENPDLAETSQGGSA